MTGTEALQAMHVHHRNLGEGVARRVGTVSAAADSDGGWEPAVGDLVAYLADEVLTHATAEEHSIYPAARARPDLDEVVAGMIDEHRRLASAVERLATATSGSDARDAAERIGSLFAAHVAKENQLILPVLAEDPAVDMAGLLIQLHRLTESAQSVTAPAESTTNDVASDLYHLLTNATDRLAGAGEGDKACRLMASAWATLRAPRPDLAVRATAALHRLVRSVTSEPVIFTPGRRPPRVAADGYPTLDVRSLAPAQRHEKIFAAYSALDPGTGFVLVNDHDPRPLRYQFEAQHQGRYSWDYLEAGPDVWRVRIGRPAAVTA